MRIVYLTAGAAGMYCGSCLHDNALAKALIGLGHDALLVPTYTPILTDETSVSSERLFYGGLNVYLQQISPVFRWLPEWSDQFLNSPRLVQWIASRAMGTNAKTLGALTVSMLKGHEGRQRKEVRRLCRWLKSLSPDVAIFSNLLIAGCSTQLKKQLDCPVVVILQGDDIFYEGLEEPYKSQSLEQLRRLAQTVDLFIVHSQDYGRRMRELLEFDESRLAVNPLSIDIGDFRSIEPAERSDQRPPSIGYLARLAPEKGLHVLVDAFIRLHRSGRQPTARLEIAGWLGPQHADYWQEQQTKLQAAGLDEYWRYHGSVDRAGKMAFLSSIDVLSVPTTYQEPKGLFVLEAVASGVPYVQPAHGAFPELHGRLRAGHLFTPEDADELTERIGEVLDDLASARQLGLQGRQTVLDSAATEHEAERLVNLLQPLVAEKQ